MADFLKRIGKTGKVSWQARVRRKGFPDTCKTFRRKADAEAWAAGIEADIARMIHVDRRVAERTTLGEALEVYRDQVTSKKAGHQEKYVIAAWLRHPLAKRSLASLRTIDFQRWVAERSKEVGPKTLRLHLGVISHMFNKAKAVLGIEGLANPIDDLMLPALPQGRDRRLMLVGEDEEALLDETEALINACKGARNPWLAPAVEFALDSAMRRGEIVQLRWEHVSLREGILRLPAAITKTDEAREVALSPRGVALLRALPRSLDGRVFPVSAEALYRAFRRAAKRAQLADLHFHDLRHEATSRLREDGLDLPEIASITGHKTLQMLKRYIHVRPRDVVAKRKRAAGE